MRSVKWTAVFGMCLCAAVLWSTTKPITSTVQGYVLDSACAFTKGLDKPISSECATACAKAGSPLVILAKDGTVYWPIADSTPATGQNDRLLPYAGKQVSASGKVYERSGSKAIVIEKLEASK
jgi:hypothetical protein